MTEYPPREVPPGTVDDLLADAKAMRLPASQRLITDWVAHGLLDRPEHRGAGQGKGSAKGEFSANQRQLFGALLQQRQSVNRLALLAQVPLVLWAYWGDAYVPTRQAEKALMTVLETREQPKVRAAQEAARFVEEIRHPAATQTAVNGLRRLIAESMTTGRLAKPKDLERAFLRVFDPRGEGRLYLPPGVDPRLAQPPSEIIAAAVQRTYGMNQFAAGKITPDHLEATRVRLQAALVHYASFNPVYAGMYGKNLVEVVAHREFQTMVDSIVQGIAYLLGGILLEERRAKASPPNAPHRR